MPDKLTDNEITIKALKEILELMLCEGDLQKTSTISHTIDLINRLQAENENLKDILYDAEGVNLVNYWYQQCKIAENGCKNFAQENKNLKADIKRLRNHIQEGAVLAKQIPEMMELAKAEARQEFAELLFKKAERRNHNSEYHYVLSDDIVDLLRELVGEGK